MLRIIAIVVVLLVGAVLIGAAMKPDAFRIERSTRIKAPPEKVFPMINDFHAWGPWSPWEKIDPGMERKYSGAASGEGAVYEWDGDRNVGAGRMRILRSSPPSEVKIDLHFTRPFEGDNIAVFTLVPDGNSTQVTWAMDGRNTYMSKLIGTFINVDKMVGDQFDTGLANLKAQSEAGAGQNG